MRFAALALTLALPLAAQTTPEGWRWQTDRPSPLAFGEKLPAGAWSVAEMIPGMHITTGPPVSLIAPGDPAAGRFMVDADLLLFPNSADNGHGVLVGARPEAQPDRVAPSWIAFLVSGDGKFAVVQRTGGTTTPLVAWTAHDAVVKRGKDVVTNRLRISVERDSLRFFANGTRVGAIQRGGLPVDGHVGLRIEEGVNLHVTNVDVVRRLLKAR